MSYCNREKSGATLRKTLALKREERFKSLKPICRICKRNLSFEEFCKGKINFCSSKECRSAVNKANGNLQDKSKISHAVKNSEKWKNSQQASLIKKKSRIENSLYKMLSSIYPNIKEQQIIFFDDKNMFVDIIINDVLIEIDGPHHSELRDKHLNQYVLENDKCLIRVDVNKHWSDIISNLGKMIYNINNSKPGIYYV